MQTLTCRQSADINGGNFYIYVQIAESDSGMAFIVLVLMLQDGYKKKKKEMSTEKSYRMFCQRKGHITGELKIYWIKNTERWVYNSVYITRTERIIEYKDLWIYHKVM